METCFDVAFTRLWNGKSCASRARATCEETARIKGEFEMVTVTAWPLVQAALNMR
jgi:hypothetical protein